LAWTGSEFGVVWINNYTDFLLFARVSTDGTEIENEIELADARRGDYFPLDLVWTGSEFGVVWVWTPGDERNGTYFNRIGFCD
jgi:hypothetical protein